MRLEGRVAIVTGASSGIGLAIARMFAEQGAHVYGADVQPPVEPSDVSHHEVDVSRADDWERLVTAVVDAHERLDVLVNNAGIVGSYDPIETIDIEVYTRVVAVNQTGVLLGMRAALPLMRRAGGGAIVNVSSIWGIVGAPGVAAYQATKGAVGTMTKNAAISYADDGIRANSLHPGLIDTPLVRAQDPKLTTGLIAETPLKRMASAREVATAALFLASDDASFVTGAELVVDGGYTVR